jgi:hypothetical protein
LRESSHDQHRLRGDNDLISRRTIGVVVAFALDDMEHLLEQHRVLLVDSPLFTGIQLASTSIEVREPLGLLVVDGRPKVQQLASQSLLLLSLNEQLAVVVGSGPSCE